MARNMSEHNVNITKSPMARGGHGGGGVSRGSLE